MSYNNVLLCGEQYLAGRTPVPEEEAGPAVVSRRTTPRRMMSCPAAGTSANATAADQGLTLVHIFAQPEPILSLKAAKHPHGTKTADVELKSGRV
jgi:hypothetical protein